MINWRVTKLIWACLLGEALFAQSPNRIDFGRDVQPIFKENCYECHGVAAQRNGFRLDRRTDAMRGGSLPVIGPGNSEGSRLYLKIAGRFGGRMPPTGALAPEQIRIIKDWIDQGAVWPDELAGETPATVADATVVRIMAALRNGDAKEFEEMLKNNPDLINSKGTAGSTILMYAALYGTADNVRTLLDRGADPNIRNDAGATALMWAADNLEKTRLLLDKGADAKVRSNDGQTPLIIATRQFGSRALVKLLLDHGANPSEASPVSSLGQITPLAEAVFTGDLATMRMLIERGRNTKGDAPLALTLAINTCPPCIDELMKFVEPSVLNRVMTGAVPLNAYSRPVPLFLEHGADANAKTPDGRSMLMATAYSQTIPVDSINALLSKGADVHTKMPTGESALDFAKRLGSTPIVDILRKAGAPEAETPPTNSVPTPKPAVSARAAFERSMPLIQRTDLSFLTKAGCISCHTTALTAMTLGAARRFGLPINEENQRAELKALRTQLDGWRERLLQGYGLPGLDDTVSYALVGLAAENYPADEATDALAHYLKVRQAPDGRWHLFAERPPIESSEIEVTATSMRGLQVYAPKTQMAEYDAAVKRAAAWLMKAKPVVTEDRVFQILGLHWAGAAKPTIREAARALIAEQRPDGGWGQIPSLGSDPYATGQALMALNESGATPVTDPVYKRGVQFLIDRQLEDGSWYVKTHAIPVQPFFESGSPHGVDQFISAAATNWAALALAPAAH
jgi:ankyrin repeat protein